MVLACDIGGTKTNVALFERKGDAVSLVRLETYRSREHAALGGILASFLAGSPARLDGACFGVAGPVIGGRVKTTNLPWHVDAAELASALGLPGVGLLNDLEATAWSVAWLGPSELRSIQLAEPGLGNVAVIAAGTGLGEAVLVRRHGALVSAASEGGHVDFAPRQEIEIELLRYLMADLGHVSYERVLSGPGLLNIYRFFRDTGRGDEPAWLAEEMKAGDPSAAISRAALAGRSALCERALELFVSIYGAAAGNLALRAMATGGVYLGGGIAPRILGQPAGQPAGAGAAAGAARRLAEILRGAFVDKGRLRGMLEAIPVHVILNDKAALYGAARFALGA